MALYGARHDAGGLFASAAAGCLPRDQTHGRAYRYSAIGLYREGRDKCAAAPRFAKWRPLPDKLAASSREMAAVYFAYDTPARSPELSLKYEAALRIRNNSTVTSLGYTLDRLKRERPDLFEARQNQGAVSQRCRRQSWIS
jgi:hypothetical protein